MAETGAGDVMKPAHLIALIVVLVVLAFLGGWFARGAPAPPAPPVVVYDTIATHATTTVTVRDTVPAHDTHADRVIDSLLASSANRERTLDSLARELAKTSNSSSTFHAVDPRGVAVSGLVAISCYPLRDEHMITVRLDTIKVPRLVETKVVVDEVLDWKLAGGLLVVGAAAGVLLAR